MNGGSYVIPKSTTKFIQGKLISDLSSGRMKLIVQGLYDQQHGQLFICMACYEGETLKERVARGPLPVESAIEIAMQIANGLAKAHQNGISHRDLKPANVMITKDGVVKILDFGLAKLAGGTRLTKTGTTMGTAAYMSPEQVQRMDVDHRTDIWSLGVVLYEMLTGQLPFEGEYEQAIMYAIVNEEPLSVRSPKSDVVLVWSKLSIKLWPKNRMNAIKISLSFLLTSSNLNCGSALTHKKRNSGILLSGLYDLVKRAGRSVAQSDFEK